MPIETPLTDTELTNALQRLPGWSRDGARLTRTVEVADFQTAVQLVNAVADAAEAANHHPDICIHDYKRVTLTLSTHDAGALTRKDTDLAAEIDQLVP